MSIRKYVSIGMLFILFGIELCAKTRADSLIEIWNRGEVGAKKSELCMKIANELSNSDTTNSLKYAFMAVGYGKSEENNSIVGDAYSLIGMLNRNTFNLDSTVNYLSPAVEYYQKSGLNTKIASVYNNMGVIYHDMKLLDSELYSYMKAVEYADPADTFHLSILYGNMGNVCFSLGDYVTAVKHFEEGMKYAISSNNTKMVAVLHNSIGNVFNEWAMPEKAIEYFRKSAELHVSSSTTDLIKTSLTNLATAFNSLNKFDSAYKYLSVSLSYPSSPEDKSVDLSEHIQLARVLISRREYSAAKNLLNSVYADIEKYGYTENLSEYYHCLLRYFIEQKKYAVAVTYDRQINDYLTDTKSNILKISIKKDFLECYLALKDFEKAYELKSQIDELMENLRNQSQRYELLQMEIRFEVAEKNYKISSLEKENSLRFKQLQYMMLIIAILAVSSVFIFIIYKKNKHIRNRLEISENSLIESNDTKNKFFSIISHDLKTPISSFNNLSSILAEYYGDLSDEERVKYVNMLRDSSSNVMTLLDNLLTWSRLQNNLIMPIPNDFSVSDHINEEIENLKQSADKKRIKVITKFGKGLVAFGDSNMFSVIIRNLLSNAVKFTPENGEIKIFTYAREDMIEVCVSDNGVGIKEDDKEKLFKLDRKHSTTGTGNEKGSGLGLNLCKEFAERNSGTIRFESRAGEGSSFIFSVPRSK